MSGYGWKQTLAEEVAVGGTVTIATPGASSPSCKLGEATLAVGNVVIASDQFALTLDVTEGENAETCTLANNSNDAWPAATEIYVGVPGATIDDAMAAIDAAQEQDAAQQAQIDTLEDETAALDDRVTALETPPVTTTKKTKR